MRHATCQARGRQRGFGNRALNQAKRASARSIRKARAALKNLSRKAKTSKTQAGRTKGFSQILKLRPAPPSDKCPPPFPSSVSVLRTSQKAWMDRASASGEMEYIMNIRVLQDENAVVFGAGGSIGAAVAKSSQRKARRSFWLVEPRLAWRL